MMEELWELPMKTYRQYLYYKKLIIFVIMKKYEIKIKDLKPNVIVRLQVDGIIDDKDPDDKIIATIKVVDYQSAMDIKSEIY